MNGTDRSSAAARAAIAVALAVTVVVIARTRCKPATLRDLPSPWDGGEFGVVWRPRGHKMERVERVTDGSLEQAIWAASRLRIIGHREARVAHLYAVPEAAA